MPTKEQKQLNAKYLSNLKLVERILGTGITTGKQLNDLAINVFGRSFKGIYGSTDKLPKLRESQCILVNAPGNNEHWVGACVKNGVMYEYDSFNRDVLGRGYVDGDFDDRADQRLQESNCGQRTIAYLVTMLS